MCPEVPAKARPDQPAVIMARSGETVTYGQLEARSNRLAHLLRAVGLRRGDHYAVFMENHPRFIECDAAGERSGLYFTNVNSFLTASECAQSEAELIGFCRKHLAHHKCPRSVAFEPQLPRSPTGKLYKGPLRDCYWKGHESHIL